MSCICSPQSQRLELDNDQLGLIVTVLYDNVLKDVSFNNQVDFPANATENFLVQSFELKKERKVSNWVVVLPVNN